MVALRAFVTGAAPLFVIARSRSGASWFMPIVLDMGGRASSRRNLICQVARRMKIRGTIRGVGRKVFENQSNKER